MIKEVIALDLVTVRALGLFELYNHSNWTSHFLFIIRKLRKSMVFVRTIIITVWEKAKLK